MPPATLHDTHVTRLRVLHTGMSDSGRSAPVQSIHHSNPPIHSSSGLFLLTASSSPAPASPLAADDDVAPDDRTYAHVLVDSVRNNARGHRELDGSGVDDANHVAWVHAYPDPFNIVGLGFTVETIKAAKMPLFAAIFAAEF